MLSHGPGNWPAVTAAERWTAGTVPAYARVVCPVNSALRGLRKTIRTRGYADRSKPAGWTRFTVSPGEKARVPVASVSPLPERELPS